MAIRNTRQSVQVARQNEPGAIRLTRISTQVARQNEPGAVRLTRLSMMVARQTRHVGPGAASENARIIYNGLSAGKIYKGVTQVWEP